MTDSQAHQPEPEWTGPVIDADVHALVPSREALFTYQDPVWVQWAIERGWEGPKGLEILYPRGAPTTFREAWRPSSQPPASTLAQLTEHVLEPTDVKAAVLSAQYAVDSIRHPDWAASLARAVNDWLVAEWLDRDDRLSGSIVVPARDPAAAVAEIERLGAHPRIVQVMMPVRSGRLYGQRVFHPIYEAMVKHDLVMGLHWGGMVDEIPSTSGFPSWYVEEYAAELHMYIGQIISLISEGVFKSFPDMRVSVQGAGFTWIPTWGWRLNKEWKGLRREIPWVDRPPLDILRDHFRFTIAPIDAGPEAQMRKVIDWLGSEDLLMYASDYPRRHDNDLAAFLDLLSPTMRENVMSETARRWYRL